MKRVENLITLRVVCTTGTYIRSLSNDLGQALGCGAYLSGLVRTRIGEQLLTQSMRIDEFEQTIKG
jgi:tRNA pseudouridine55 synthase